MRTLMKTIAVVLVITTAISPTVATARSKNAKGYKSVVISSTSTSPDWVNEFLASMSYSSN